MANLTREQQDEILHVVRNPYGYAPEQIRSACLQLADLYESLRAVQPSEATVVWTAADVKRLDDALERCFGQPSKAPPGYESVPMGPVGATYGLSGMPIEASKESAQPADPELAGLIESVQAIADRMLGLPTMFDNDELLTMDKVLARLSGRKDDWHDFEGYDAKERDER